MTKHCIDTPCIGVCSTVYGDAVCRGCKRRFQEVIDWNGFSVEQKHSVYERLHQQMETILQQFLVIEDVESLLLHLQRKAVRYRPDHPAVSWALQWLRFGDDTPLSEVGLKALQTEMGESRRALFHAVDTAFWELANQEIAV